MPARLSLQNRRMLDDASVESRSSVRCRALTAARPMLTRLPGSVKQGASALAAPMLCAACPASQIARVADQLARELW
jgi:hypothetical protein